MTQYQRKEGSSAGEQPAEGNWIVHPLSNPIPCPPWAAGSGQMTASTSCGTTYRCYLPVLAGFMDAGCDGSGLRRHLSHG